MITFGGQYYNYFPNNGAPFPINTNSLGGGLVAAIVAPYMADVDNSVGNGTVWFRTSSNAALLSKAKSDIPVALSVLDYTPQLLLIATWDRVGYFRQHTDKVLQCILIQIFSLQISTSLEAHSNI